MTPTVCSWTGWTGDYLIMVKISSVSKWALCNNLLKNRSGSTARLWVSTVRLLTYLFTSRSANVNMSHIRIAFV